MTKTLKKDFLPGGSKRQYILDKAVDYLLQEPGLQADKHAFCTRKYLMMTETEYLEALNKATNGERSGVCIMELKIIDNVNR